MKGDSDMDGTRSMALGLAALLCCALVVQADQKVKARLGPFGEVPAVSSTGSGEFTATVGDDTIEYELTYAGLEGTTVVAAHIHLGQKDVNGGVSAFLCGGGDKPPCPLEGTVRGTIDADDVIGPVGQGIAAGELAELIAAIRAGQTYANVHTNKHPGGEIRGQIREDSGRD